MTYDDLDEQRDVPSGAVGGVAFAAMLMSTIGVFSIVAGLASIIDEGSVSATPRYAFDLDPTAWGWVHLVLGVAAVAVGIGLFTNAAWADWVGIILAGLVAIDYFFFIPKQPFWSLLVIALSIWVIWSITQARASDA
ncbi:hypothetical protein AB0E63_35565 [Kribbella sp. NPDC026596]|uniref:DUF7144 family membrane protein n=1 Tax=Kribbella sp. NPDC026596 TaxID=3155122 RepID=UPI0033DB2360